MSVLLTCRCGCGRTQSLSKEGAVGAGITLTEARELGWHDVVGVMEPPDYDLTSAVGTSPLCKRDSEPLVKELLGKMMGEAATAGIQVEDVAAEMIGQSISVMQHFGHTRDSVTFYVREMVDAAFGRKTMDEVRANLDRDRTTFTTSWGEALALLSLGVCCVVVVGTLLGGWQGACWMVGGILTAQLSSAVAWKVAPQLVVALVEWFEAEVARRARR